MQAQERKVKGNKRGLKWAEKLVNNWMAERGIDPAAVHVHYAFGEQDGAPVFGLSMIEYDTIMVGLKRSLEVARFSARTHAVEAAKCHLFGALIQSPDFKTLYGMVDFPVFFGQEMVDEAVSYLCDMNTEAWREDGMPVLVYTKGGLARRDEVAQCPPPPPPQRAGHRPRS